MMKLYLVAKHEYLNLVKKRSFLFSTLGFPVLICVVIAISIFASFGSEGDLPVGYVDRTGMLSSPVGNINDIKDELFVAYETKESALVELRDQRLQAVYIIPTDYQTHGNVELYYLTDWPSEAVQTYFKEYIKAHLLSQQTPEIQRRLIDGANLVIKSEDSSRVFDTRNIYSFFVPFIAAFLFVIAVMSAGGYMLEAVTEEKENRTIEILATSLQPETLIGGKALGLMSVGLTQLLIWAVTGMAGVLVLGQFYEQIKSIRFPWTTLAVVTLFFLPAYALMSGMMTVIGSIVTDSRQGQQISSVVNLLFTSPFFFMSLIMAKPNHPIVIGLSFFPTTAFITTTMRWAMTTIPLWQLLMSLSLLSSFAVISIWVAARIFRIGMLQYGQQLNIGRLLKLLKTR